MSNALKPRSQSEAPIENYKNVKKKRSFLESKYFTPIAIVMGIAAFGVIVWLIRTYAPHTAGTAAEISGETATASADRYNESNGLTEYSAAEDWDGSFHFTLSAPEKAAEEETDPPRPIGPVPEDLIYYRSQYRGAMYDDVDFTVAGDEICVRITFDVADAVLGDAHLAFSIAEGECSFLDPTDPDNIPDYYHASGTVDLTAEPILYVTTASGTYAYRVTYERKSCDLPVLYLTTEDGEDVTSRDEYVAAHLSLDGEEYEMEIRGRGNASWTRFPQKSYMLRFDQAVSFFGMLPDTKWVLISTYGDPSLIRNPVSMAIAGYMDGMEYTPRQLPVDIFLNGRYLGVYTFSEKIEIGTDKLELFSETSPEDYAAQRAALMTEDEDETAADEDPSAAEETAIETTGEEAPETAFLLELGEDLFGTHIQGQEWFYSPYLPQVYVRYPEFDEPGTEEFKYIESYIRATGQAIVNGRNYLDYIDLSSWVDWFIVMELTNNTDSAFCRSTFLYKRSGEKLMLGPVWDFDMALGNFLDNPSYAYWATAEAIYAPAQGHYISYLYNSDAFMDAVRERWDACKEGLLQTAFDAVDTYGAQVARSRVYNNKLWGYRGSEAQVTYIRNFIQRRYDWIDRSLHTPGYNRHPATVSTYGVDIVMQVPMLDENGDPVLDEQGNPILTLITIPRETEEEEEIDYNVESETK